MHPVNSLSVHYRNRKVGTLAQAVEGLVVFEYADTWLASGFALNPFSLPLEKQVFMPNRQPLNGMFGVFQDSLPDGWGRLLVDRFLRSRGVNPSEISDLARLALVDLSGMGALSYRPQWDIEEGQARTQDFDRLSKEASKVLANQTSDDLDELFELGGSSGGARPKIFATIEGEDWIVKFPSSLDPTNIGLQEYKYALCAKDCGITFSEVRLLPSKYHEGYFATKRFDRNSDHQGIHMISAAGLLETSHRYPNLDYLDLMKLTLALTSDYTEVKRLYRLMCFNIYAHNLDDHSKNFSFLYDEESRSWSLSPAYDLTYSSSFNGEHATTVAGKGRGITEEDLLEVAHATGLSKSWARTAVHDIQEKANSLKPFMQ